MKSAHHVTDRATIGNTAATQVEHQATAVIANVPAAAELRSQHE